MSLGQKRKEGQPKPAEFAADCQPERISRRIKHDRRRAAMPRGTAVDDRSTLIRLQRELARLKEQVAVLQDLVDPDEISAAQRLRDRHLTNEQLRIWSESQIVPEAVAEADEERPW
jgi:hypothetical protein